MVSPSRTFFSILKTVIMHFAEKKVGLEKRREEKKIFKNHYRLFSIQLRRMISDSSFFPSKGNKIYYFLGSNACNINGPFNNWRNMWRLWNDGKKYYVEVILDILSVLKQPLRLRNLTSVVSKTEIAILRKQKVWPKTIFANWVRNGFRSQDAKLQTINQTRSPFDLQLTPIQIHYD